MESLALLTGKLGGALVYPLAFVFVLSIVVFIHEYGHFWVGRRCGVGVTTFSVGFGPELWGWTDRYGTRWKLSAIPLGGYVKFVGDMNGASVPDDETLAQMNEHERSISFHHQPLWKRAAIVAAGPIANFLLAIVIFATLAFVTGRQVLLPRIEAVQAGSVAESAGFRAGDLILSIDGRRMTSFSDVQRIVSTSAGDSLTFLVQREERRVTIVATPAVREVDVPGFAKQRLGMIGLHASQNPADLSYVRYGVVDSLTHGVTETWAILDRTVNLVVRLVRGKESPDQLSGPIGIMRVSGEVASNGGIGPLMSLMAILSVSIGLLNLFPVPMLDGGHLMFYAIEALRGRPLSDRAQEIGFRIGLALVLMLMLFSTWNDIVHLGASFTGRGT
jgi:regulator of sigma E protease